MRYLTVIASLICMIFTANAAKADRRVAFVVGNGAYKNVPALPNPPNDARDVARALKALGFRVTLLTNADRAQFEKDVANFGRAAAVSYVPLFITEGTGFR